MYILIRCPHRHPHLSTMDVHNGMLLINLNLCYLSMTLRSRSPTNVQNSHPISEVDFCHGPLSDPSSKAWLLGHPAVCTAMPRTCQAPLRDCQVLHIYIAHSSLNLHTIPSHCPPPRPAPTCSSAHFASHQPPAQVTRSFPPTHRLPWRRPRLPPSSGSSCLHSVPWPSPSALSMLLIPTPSRPSVWRICLPLRLW